MAVWHWGNPECKTQLTCIFFCLLSRFNLDTDYLHPGLKNPGYGWARIREGLLYMSMVDVVGARGRTPVKWQNRVLENMRERGEKRMKGLEHTSRECKDRNKWRLFCCGHPLIGVVLRKRHQIQTDRLIWEKLSFDISWCMGITTNKNGKF